MSNVYSYNYLQAYSPAMPIVEVSLSASAPQTSEITIEAILDTGADASLIPVSVLTSMGARYTSQARLRGITGDTQWVNLYLVNMKIGSYLIYAVEVIASDNNETILGRDVLNQLNIRLDGPAEVTEIGS